MFDTVYNFIMEDWVGFLTQLFFAVTILMMIFDKQKTPLMI